MSIFGLHLDLVHVPTREEAMLRPSFSSDEKNAAFPTLTSSTRAFTLSAAFLDIMEAGKIMKKITNITCINFFKSKKPT